MQFYPGENLIRKLGKCESMYAEKNITTSSAYTLQSNVNIYKDLTIFERAIGEWQKRDAYLQCKLHKSDQNEFFFEHLPNPQKFLKQNLTFLKLKSDKLLSSQDELQIWAALLQLEPFIEMHSFDDLLWRLKLIELSPNPINNDMYNYVLIFTSHHSIVEGRGSMLKLLELLQIFENLSLDNNNNNNNNTNSDYLGIIPSFESLVNERLANIRMHPFLSQSELQIDEILGELSKFKSDQDDVQSEYNASNLHNFGTNDFLFEPSSKDKIYIKFNDLFKKVKISIFFIN